MWKPEDSLECFSSGAVHLYFIETRSLIGLDSLSGLGWMASNPQGPPCLCQPQCWYLHLAHMNYLSSSQVPMLAREAISAVIVLTVCCAEMLSPPSPPSHSDPF